MSTKPGGFDVRFLGFPRIKVFVLKFHIRGFIQLPHPVLVQCHSLCPPEEFGQFGTMILTQLSILHSCGRLLVITGDFYGILHSSTYMYLLHLITGITRAITASFTISKKRPDVHLGPKVPKVEAGLRTMEPG